MKNLNDVSILDELHKAIRPHTPAERAALKAEIEQDGSIHDPILWAHLYGGVEAVVDGHTRLSIYEELLNEQPDAYLEEPKLVEVESLRDCSVDEAVEWIKRHQSARRNIDSVASLYGVGKEFLETEATSTELAEKYGLTPSQVRHAGALAENVDQADALEPGTKEAVLESDMSKSFLRDAEPEDIVASARPGAAKPKGPLDSFKPLTKAVAKAIAEMKVASRAVNALQNEQTPNEYSEQCVEYIRSLNAFLEDLQAEVERWIGASV